MDKGAHFHKCDLQVHSPRDENWSGQDAVSDGERSEYAEELIRACREKGLDAIAITDHHDFCFFPYVRKAAESELDDAGNPIPEAKRIVVFPGMELTLTAPNCQALLILDADFPENLLQSVLTTLTITPAAATDRRHATVQRIPQNVIGDLTALYEKLNSQQHLNGRFVVLPNINERGYGTMLRSGFANFYKTMPCVGGYCDGPATNFGTGNLAILRGENREYGNKSIAVLQTSDNRRRDHANLGQHVTWVKWSEPTAEAFRQACLAKESRLSLEEPDLPNLWIASVSVSNSKFLGRVEVDFNQQYNAVIGGRGTGKSTVLEYLRWGLCDQPVESSESDIAPVQGRRKKLIDDTLSRFDGEVIVTFFLNEIKHIVKRSTKKQEILLRIGDAEFVQTTEQEVRNLFPIQAYSQKQLSSVGVRIEELRRFVELPIKQQLDQVRSSIHDAQVRIRTAYANLTRKREIQREIAKYSVEITSLTKQVAALRKRLKGLSQSEQAIIDQKTEHDNEELIVESLQRELVRVRDLVEVLEGDLSTQEVAEDLEVYNKELIGSIRSKFEDKFAQVRKQVRSTSTLLDAKALKDIDTAVANWLKVKKEFEKKYESARARATASQQQLRQIQQVEKRIADLKKLQMANRNTLSRLAEPETQYRELRSTWDEFHTQKIELLDEQCGKFSALSASLIKAEIEGAIDVESLKHAIKTAFGGLNIKEVKIEKLCQQILASSDPIATWNKILAELESLSLHKTTGAEVLPPTAMLDECEFITSEKTRLVAGLDANKWLELSVTELEVNPAFLYCTNKETDEYIAFADASAGQQATALLTVLLNQSGAPLIIDQPEDDIDSKMSADIVQRIWEAKSRRQLLFASHNANFVVNGDAELVMCCDYVRAGDQTGGEIKAVGAIDNRVIRDEITTVTEGGKAAFKLRKEKYGF